MTSAVLVEVGNHLWQSTVFVGLAWLLTLGLKRNRAAVRYWVWFAASVKFLIPFAVLVELGSRIEWRSPPVVAQPEFTAVVSQLGSPFEVSPRMGQAVAAAVDPAFPWAAVLLGIWLCGFGAGCAFWIRQWRKAVAIRRGATSLSLGLSVPVLQAGEQVRLEPAVYGIIKPVLIVPVGLTEALTSAELQAVIAHEMQHVRRKDNLTAAVHMVVEMVFWFHPLVWWLRHRLVAERERACDEAVAEIHNPRVYAEAILGVCKLCVSSSLPCVSGVTGSGLKRRIEAIVQNRRALRLDVARRIWLGMAAVGAVGAPLVTGILNAPAVRAQSPAPETGSGAKATFEVASIRTAVTPGRGPAICLTPCSPGERFTVQGGRVEIRFMPVSALLARAWRVHPYQISGPATMRDRKFDISAKLPEGVPAGRIPEMLQSLLEERFKLRVHRETRTLPVLALVVANGGIKLEPADPQAIVQPAPGPKALKMFTPEGDAHMEKGRIIVSSGILGPARTLGGGKWEMMGITMPALAELLMADEDRPVLDETNLSGAYRLVYDINVGEGGEGDHAGAENPVRASLRQAIQRGGLRLERRNAPIEMIVVDSVEKLPTAN